MFEVEEVEVAHFFLRVVLGRFLLSQESGRGRGSRTASAVLGFLAFGGIVVTIKGFLNIQPVQRSQDRARVHGGGFAMFEEALNLRLGKVEPASLVSAGLKHAPWTLTSSPFVASSTFKRGSSSVNLKTETQKFHKELLTCWYSSSRSIPEGQRSPQSNVFQNLCTVFLF